MKLLKKSALLLLTLAFMASPEIIGAQEIELPAHEKNSAKMSVSQALATRHSVREYSSKELSAQELSNVCWAAVGMSRDDNHRTSPTAMNRQEIRLFVFDKNAVYEYMAKTNVLKQVVKGDHRDLLAGGKFPQKFVMDAPVTLLMVIDFDLFKSQDEHARQMTCVDAGIVSENINLYCQAAGLVTVPRAQMDKEAISKLLGLSSRQLPILNNPIGYPKERD